MFRTAINRRAFLASTGAAFGALITAGVPALASPVHRLTIARRVIDVNGRAASVFGLTDGNGRPGLTLEPGERFSVALENRIGEPTIVHWHGQTPPPDQDGVAETGYAGLVPDGATQTYDFEPRPGTHWMHSHAGLQEQQLLAAPLVVRTASDAAADRQEVTVMLHDFSFRDPQEILATLTDGANADGHAGMDMGGAGGMAMGDMPMTGSGMGAMGGMGMMGGMDLNDIEYDAYLANDRTLDDPMVVRTEAGGRVLVRLINAATATAFWIDLGDASGTAVAVDGNPIVPRAGSRFPLAQGQRLDLEVIVPAGAVVAVLAQREGDRPRTGIVLAAPGAVVGKIAGVAAEPAAPADLSLETALSAAEAVSDRAADVAYVTMLSGSMAPYVWTIDGATWANRRPLAVRQGQWVIVEIMNHSMMAHPMHLHGHHFRVVAINGTAINGAVRDTVLVPPMSRVALAFDAENPGRWLFHCHNLYHMATGMMTELTYAGTA